MKTFLMSTLILSLIITTSNAFANIYQTDWLTIQEIDSLGIEGAYITLSGYTDPNCDQNRIYMIDDDLDNYKEIMAILLSAFHTNTEVRLEINATSFPCKSDRAMMRK